MNIAFVYDAVYPWVTGGAQKRVWELARRLSDRHEVHWYGQHYWNGPKEHEREGVILHGVCEPTDLYVGDRRSIKQVLYFTANLLPELVGNDHDVIDCQEFPYFPCFVSQLVSIPENTEQVITWYEVWDDYWFEYLGKGGHLGKLVERSVAKLPATHIASSEMTRSQLHQLGADDVRVSPLGIDFDQLQEIPAKDRTIDFIFGGRLIPEKNVLLFIEALNELITDGYDVTALIIGEGPDRDKAESRIADLEIGDSVEVIDFVEHSDFLGYIKAADVFAFPSQREGFGLVGLEALACGTPVVTSNHHQNAAQELIQRGKTGFICELDPSDLARQLIRAGSIDPDSCRSFARQYSWGTIVEQMEDHYTDILS